MNTLAALALTLALTLTSAGTEAEASLPDTTVRTTAPTGIIPIGAVSVSGASRTIVTTATWYCLPGRSACSRGYASSGHYAAAGSALRIGKWRGSSVMVCRLGLQPLCVATRLIDWCSCRGIDLYASVFRKLAPLSRGRITVTISR